MIPHVVCKDVQVSLARNSQTAENRSPENMPPASHGSLKAMGDPVICNGKPKTPPILTSIILKYPNSISYFGRFITKMLILNKNPSELDTSTFLNNSKPAVYGILAEALRHLEQITFYLSLYLNCTQNYDEEDIKPFAPSFKPENKTFETKVVVLRCSTEIEDAVEVLTTLIALESNEKVSLCAVNEIIHLEIGIKPLPRKKGVFLPLPEDIKTSRSVVNVQNYDNFCFKWAIINGVSNITSSNLNRTTIYRIPDITRDKIECFGMILDFSDLHFPVNVWDTKMFEQRNPNISVNVFGFENIDKKSSKITGPLYRTRKIKPKHINLLYFEDEENSICHYACIRSMSRLLRKQFTSVHTKVDICNMCLKHFCSQAAFEKHKNCTKLRVL